MDHRILLEDVHLLDAGDLLHAQTLDGVIQTLVVVRRGLVHGFVLTARLKRTQRNANRRSVARSCGKTECGRVARTSPEPAHGALRETPRADRTARSAQSGRGASSARLAGRVCPSARRPRASATRAVARRKSRSLSPRCPSGGKTVYVPAHGTLATHADGARELLELLNVHGNFLRECVGQRTRGQSGCSSAEGSRVRLRRRARHRVPQSTRCATRVFRVRVLVREDTHL